MKSALLPLAALLVGLFAGTFVGKRLAPATASAPSVPVAPRESDSAKGGRAGEPSLEHVASPRETVPAQPATDPGGDSRAPSGELIGPLLREYARTGMRAAWKTSRADEIDDERLGRGMHEFETSVLALPAAIGRRMAEERTREELLARDATTGGAFALLEKLAKTPTPMLGLATDPTAMRSLFARAEPETPVHAVRFGKLLAKNIEPGKTYSYPAGVFPIEINFNGVRPIPADVTIAGAGMDATMLVLSQDIFAAEPLQRFSIRDCTVFTNNHYLFDQRGAPATVLLERVRVIGFDMGAGSSCALSFSGGLVLLARDCRFEGGYGRHPEYGQLMRIDSPALIVRMERCRIDRVTLGVDGLEAGSTLAFWQCTLNDLLDSQVRFSTVAQRQQFEQNLRGRAGLQFQSTTISFFENSAWNLAPTTWDVPTRDLNELFPGWKQALGN